MNVPKELRYMKSHEWAKQEGGKVRVGISDHAQHEITDVVHVELPAVGKKVEQGQPCAVVESVKSAFDIYAPVSGTVVEVNDALSSSPELVNQSPYEKGFFLVIEASNQAEWEKLLPAQDYEKLIG
ncbi:MAG TPA: glycine cleavage system protein GcvH [Elusimicrobia bacterium]|nr:MAG: glycine cleavage system protein H [Elusimicrobia bacterium RIFOXYA12_FULL_49_49]OGS10721.1 MAG: glycine cleavage system protein H [Elusimicrobia bacterium RIFOXYB1_FULL_48_9]OGS15338.1 MAG: glycine cleavage system protein H [Elusimicrobia bacterium RIFOXYA2_FULL_47_53]OGS26468.1 MAG: glycine cleavage system protein H [Elusimicrobia bacterium RIFOXYB12_FULL_50_12]OGS30593.1 MAG: glycine cleavage system protein H [Elusimicrobia bacterium RIFOXYB2_FULL_46_23]HBU69898.1 glycine cleavage sy